MKTPHLIQDAAAVAEMAGNIRGKNRLGIDTEFIRETSFFPKIALIQVATDTQSWLLDPTRLSKEDLQPLLAILADASVLKIMHAAFADQECLYWSYGMVAQPVLDTAVAGALCGYGDNVGLAKLLKEILQVSVPKGRSRVKWLARPLPRELLVYAEQDVAYLVALGEALLARLSSRGRVDWAIAESYLDASAFEVSPEELAMKMARNGQMDPGTYLVLRELVRWREERARTANMPRGWIADNEVLVALAKSRPARIDELRSFRGLSAKEVDRNGERILEAIRRGKEAPREEVHLPSRAPIPSEHEDHALDLLKAYVAYLAARHAIAPRYLLHSSRALALLQNPEKTAAEWVELGILTPPAKELVGDELKALLSGNRALVLRGGKVEILPL
jgi:ribonuclease D